LAPLSSGRGFLSVAHKVHLERIDSATLLWDIPRKVIQSAQTRKCIRGRLADDARPLTKQPAEAKVGPGNLTGDLARWFKMRNIRLLLLAVLILAIPAASFAQFGVSVMIAPPALPIYTQPMLPQPVICGRPAIGLTGMKDTSGCLAPGSSHPRLACFGLPVIGGGAATPSPGMKATGVRRSASTVASTTVSDTAVSAMEADTGTTEPSTTTDQ